MLWTASGIKGYAILASDGKIGTVADFLFDDDSWLVRWLVVDTGNWLSGRKVLLPPFVLGHADPAKREFSVKLTMAQVKDSPDVDTERSVRDRWKAMFMITMVGGRTGAPGFTWAATAMRAMPGPDYHRWDHGITKRKSASNQRNNDDPHLRSIEAVTGYHINASDGEIGHVETMLVDDADWSIHYLVVDTKNWWPGEEGPDLSGVSA
jgi:sporulation protein YlmC with PRC-barrel domain